MCTVSDGSFSIVVDSDPEHATAIEEVGLYVAGRGPGNYSGMRAAITTAESLALPGNTPLLAVSSGLAVTSAVEVAVGVVLGLAVGVCVAVREGVRVIDAVAVGSSGTPMQPSMQSPSAVGTKRVSL